MIFYIIYCMTSVSIIRQFYASPRTLIILLPLLEGITDETLPPKSDGFYLRLGKIKLCRCQCIWQGFRTITSFADIWRLHWKVASAIVMNVVFWSMKSRSDAKEPKTNRNYFLRSEAYEIENSCHGLFVLSQGHNKIRKLYEGFRYVLRKW